MIDLSEVLDVVRDLKICSKILIKRKFGYNAIRMLKNSNEVAFTKYLVYHIKSLFSAPLSIKELSILFSLKREAISYNLDKLVSVGRLKSVHRNGSDKFYYLKGSNPNFKLLYMGKTQKNILSLLDIGPMSSLNIAQNLNINRNALLSSLSNLRRKGFVDSVNAVGNGSSKFFWFLKNNILHRKLAHILAMGMENVIKILSIMPVRLKILVDKLEMTKGTLLHKLRRLIDNKVVKRFKNGRYFVYYLSNCQKILAMIESLSSRQKFIYDLLQERKLKVLEIRDLCGFKNDEGYRVKNALKILLQFGLVTHYENNKFGTSIIKFNKEGSIYDDLLSYLNNISRINDVLSRDFISVQEDLINYRVSNILEEIFIKKEIKNLKGELSLKGKELIYVRDKDVSQFTKNKKFSEYNLIRQNIRNREERLRELTVFNKTSNPKNLGSDLFFYIVYINDDGKITYLDHTKNIRGAQEFFKFQSNYLKKLGKENRVKLFNASDMYDVREKFYKRNMATA